MRIKRFTMEDVRCFAGRQDFDIRPLTFLVGENSTGKTTALGCFQVLADYLNRRRELDFNRDPYSMGIFKDIVRSSRPKNTVFKLGFTLEDKNETVVEHSVDCVASKDGIEPACKSATMTFPDGEIIFEIKEEENRPGMSFSSADRKRNRYRIYMHPNMMINHHPYHSLDVYMDLLEFNPFSRSREQSEDKKAFMKYLGKKRQTLPMWGIVKGLSVFSISPIRSRPKRTYDPTRTLHDPEGSDIPMWLMKTKITRKEEWKALQKSLVKFGNNSGLFQNIDIKTLGGSSISNPFQVKVKVRGPNSNIIDVGYGVSQILPILFHIFAQSSHSQNLLLQQPEVHLHPRAQAELSSLLATVANEGKKSFIIETHSDYMINRASIEIRKGRIKPEDVSLIYLEPKAKGGAVEAHNIRFDEEGNVEGTPKGYREFFLKETDRFMGLED